MGTQLSVAYPLSLYSRFNFGTQVAWRTRTWKVVSDAEYDGWGWNYDLKDDSLAAPERINTVELLLSWSFDNAQWGITGPAEGARLWASVRGIPPNVLQDRYAYWRADMDMRKYFRLFQRYTFAFRAAGGMSEPIKGYENPHRYLLGGDEWTINWNINNDHWHGTQEDVFFSSWETPLRGFRYNDFEGTRMGVANVEFRFPFIDRLSFGWPIPLTITNVTGVLFTDVGGTWNNRETMEERGWGYGWGWRLNLGIFVLRYTRAWSVHEFSTVDRNDYTYWSLGAEF
jgi:outer membrane protein assembly factor BamA